MMLGDMPDVSALTIDRLIAAFDPEEGSRHLRRHASTASAATRSCGRASSFPRSRALEGDVGAKHLIVENAELVCEVEMADDGPCSTSTRRRRSWPNGRGAHERPALQARNCCGSPQTPTVPGGLPRTTSPAMPTIPPAATRSPSISRSTDGRITAIGTRHKSLRADTGVGVDPGAERSSGLDARRHRSASNRRGRHARRPAVRRAGTAIRRPTGPSTEPLAYRSRHRCVLLPIEAVLAAFDDIRSRAK